MFFFRTVVFETERLNKSSNSGKTRRVTATMEQPEAATEIEIDYGAAGDATCVEWQQIEKSHRDCGA